MEALAVKFNILAGLFGVIGLVGLAALLGSIIFLIIRVANFDSVLPALLCVVLSLALTAGGLVVSPTPEVVHTGPALWEAPLEALKERLANLKDNGPWARFLKDKDAEGAPAEDAPREGGPAEDVPDDAAGAGADGTASPEEVAERQDMPEAAGEGGQNSADAMLSPDIVEVASTLEGDKRFLETELNGCRLKLTLPESWDDIKCVFLQQYGTLHLYRRDVFSQSEEDWLFSLEVLDTPIPDNYLGHPYNLSQKREILKEQGGKALAYKGRLKSPEYISETYREMRDAIPGILDTIEFEVL